jgi:hypothetical protein
MATIIITYLIALSIDELDSFLYRILTFWFLFKNIPAVYSELMALNLSFSSLGSRLWAFTELAVASKLEVKNTFASKPMIMKMLGKHIIVMNRKFKCISPLFVVFSGSFLELKCNEKLLKRRVYVKRSSVYFASAFICEFNWTNYDSKKKHAGLV